MARSRGRSRSQRILRTMTRGLPLPVRVLVTRRTGLLIVAIGVPTFLLLTGILTWSRDDQGSPEVSIDRERVQQMEQRVAEGVDTFRQRLRSGLGEAASLRAPDGSFNPFWSSHEEQVALESSASQEFSNPHASATDSAFQAPPEPPVRQSLLGDRTPRWR